MNEFFRRVATRTSDAVGSPWAFIGAVVLVLGWAATGPMYGYSDTWQLVINTGTDILIFLIVFLIQNTQNRHSKAIELKLDELLRGSTGARTSLVRLEEMTDDELERLREEFERLRRHERRGPAPS